MGSSRASRMSGLPRNCATGLPVIDVSAALPTLAFARVATQATGAATHLRERGLQHFGYCGDQRFHWARLRGEAFAAAVRPFANERCGVFAPTPGPVDAEVEEIARWLRTLPLPIGVLAVSIFAANRCSRHAGSRG